MATNNNEASQTTVKDTRLPDSITIGENTFVIKDTPELLSLISKIAQNEKSKLYSQIENLKDALAKLDNVNVEPADFSGIKKELMDAMTSKITEIIQPLIEKTRIIETNSIEEYRNKLINDNKDICIPEMVEGKTKEELDAALQRSIEVRKRYPTSNPTVTPTGSAPVVDPVIKHQMDLANADNSANSLVNNNAAPIRSSQNLKPTDPVPNIPVGQPTQTDISRLTADEFKARREELRAQISNLV